MNQRTLLWRDERSLSHAFASVLAFVVVLFGWAGLYAATEYVEGDVIVTFKATATLAAAKTALGKKSMAFSRHFGLLSTKQRHQVGLVRHTTKTTAELINDLKNDPAVETVEPNYLRRVSAQPNDTRFAEMWALKNTGQTVNGTAGTAGADISFIAARALVRPPPTGEVVVAVIDSGVDYVHPDLAANMWTNQAEIAGNDIDDDANGYKDDLHGYDFADVDADPSDSGYHGTHVAGTIAAIGDNQSGTIGVNDRARIMALKVSTNGTLFSSAAIIEALQYVTLMKGRGINIVAVNASYGGGGNSASESAAIQTAGDAGIIFCAAAGNDGTSNDTTPTYPANYRLASMIVVAATDQNDALASYSNYGATTVDIAAPGSNILSLQPSGSFQAGGTTYTSVPLTFSGVTSGLSGNLIDCGIGDTGQFPATVNGNIALIARGTLTFAVKVANAKAAGATAAIIYNNVTGGTFNGTLGTAGAWIPARAISQADGLAIKAALPKTGAIIATGNYQFLNGTSMATPHVAGAVAFAAMNNPGETILQRRQRILNSVDVKPGLSGKAATEGRLNLLRVVDANLNGVADWYEQTPTLTTASMLAGGTTGTTYSATLAVTNGTAPFTFAVTSGTLPSGLSLSAGGVISGTPTTSGTSSFTITVTGVGGFNSSKAFTVTINTPFASWTANLFTVSEQADASISGAMADPNHNGTVNLLEFALNRDPKAANFTPPLALGSETDSATGNKYLTVTYTRRIAASGITYHDEVSSDLTTWNSGNLYTEEASVADDGNGITQTVKVRVMTPMNQANRIFVRLRVTEP